MSTRRSYLFARRRGNFFVIIRQTVRVLMLGCVEAERIMTMRCNEITPCSALRPFIDRYWCWTEEPSAPRRLPGTGHELMLHFGTPWRARTSEQEFSLPRAYVVTPRSKSWKNAVRGSTGFLAVRFRAGAFRHFCGESIELFADQISETSQIWKAGRLGCSKR